MPTCIHTYYIYLSIYKHKDICTHTYLYTQICFIIQGVKARAIPCPHQSRTRGDNTVSVAQGSTATTKQLLPSDRVLRELYIYIIYIIY